MSNLVLNCQLKLKQLTFSHQTLQEMGVNVIRDTVTNIQGQDKKVTLSGGGSVNYDCLVVATGIGFKILPGTDFDLTPHAWIAGPQTNLLSSQIESMREGSTFVMTIPKSPYRCPPGPYERACVVANILQRKGWDNGDTRVIVLDENSSIQAERATFERAFNSLYRNLIEYIPNAEVQMIDSANRRIGTSTGEY